MLNQPGNDSHVVFPHLGDLVLLLIFGHDIPPKSNNESVLFPNQPTSPPTPESFFFCLSPTIIAFPCNATAVQPVFVKYTLE